MQCPTRTKKGAALNALPPGKGSVSERRRSLYRDLQATAFLVGDPRRDLIVVVGDVVLGDIVGGSVPDALMAQNVFERLVEIFGRIRPADIVGMQRQAHDPAAFGTLSIERIELVLDHL